MKTVAHGGALWVSLLACNGTRRLGESSKEVEGEERTSAESSLDSWPAEMGRLPNSNVIFGWDIFDKTLLKPFQAARLSLKIKSEEPRV